MRTQLTCDDVFDVLTQAPFPAGRSEDDSVESHLKVCHECRQLAEALRPAVGLFHEVIAEDGEQELPVYRGRLAAIVDSSVPREEAWGREAQQGQTWARRAGPWAAVAACVACAFWLGMASGPPERPSKADYSAHALGLLSDYNLALLTSLELPSDCTTPAPKNYHAAFHYECCTRCHHARGGTASSERAIVKSAAACLACHDWSTPQLSRWSAAFPRET